MSGILLDSMQIQRLHAWPRSTRAAIALQAQLSARVRLTPLCRTPRIFAGGDIAFSSDGAEVIAGVVIWERPHEKTSPSTPGRVLETQLVRRRCRFPYVPGLLSFRELPALLAALRRVRTTPDVLLCDGQGLAHPRRFGLACHAGVWLGLPTIGCAKSRLCGEFDPPGPMRGTATPLRFHGENVGAVLRTRHGVQPLFVSPGHLCDMADAIRITLLACGRYRLPEPTRLAHQLVSRARG